MNFWLTFIQSLPTIPVPQLMEKETIETKNSSSDLETVAVIQSPTTSPTLAQLDPLSDGGGLLALVGGGIVFLIVFVLICVFVYTRFYVIAPTNEALVVAGGVVQKKKRVVLNGGCIVIPGFHEVTRVPLKEISIDVVRSGNSAVRTQDYLRANMRVTFYVCINAEEKDILTAAARISEKGRISDKDIKQAIENRADDAIRAAAKQKRIAEIDSDKIGFADAVLNLIQEDLKKVGLTLNNIAISEIEESDTYNENDYFDAQGVKLRTETIQKSIQQKVEVELATKVAIEEKELEAEKLSLTIARDKENASLSQQKELEFLRAQQQREIQESKDKEAAKMEKTRLLQEQSVEEEKIQQKLAVQQKQIESNIALEEQNKQFKVAQTLQQQEAEVAEITRQKTIEASNLQARAEVATAKQQSQIAQQQAEIAIATKEKERLEAEAAKAEAESAVVTATEVEKAERESRLSMIAAEREAQERRIADQNVVEIDVFRRRRSAEIARQAAELEAESIRTLAEANRYKALAEAEGKRALIQAENALSTANRTADLIKAIFPDLAPQLPEMVKAITPQPGILGDTRIYSFPGANGHNGNGNGVSGIGDINKLLLSTSGLTLINSLLDEGKLKEVVTYMKDLLSSRSGDTITPPQPETVSHYPVTSPSQTDATPPTDSAVSSPNWDELLNNDDLTG